MQSFPKIKADKPLAVSPGPYLHSRESTPKFFWWTLAALLPVLIGRVILSGWFALWTYSAALGCSILFESIFEFITRQRNRVHDGSSALIVILFSLFLPAHVPFQLILTGVFISVVVAKELFGGVGQDLFHPALIGYASVFILFPNFFPNGFQALGTSELVLVLTSAFILIFKKLIRWETVLFYLGFGLLAAHSLNDVSFLIFVAFFLVTDPATSPIMKEGRVLFATLAGLLTAAFALSMRIDQAAVAAILISDAAIPLMDRCVQSCP